MCVHFLPSNEPAAPEEEDNHGWHKNKPAAPLFPHYIKEKDLKSLLSPTTTVPYLPKRNMNVVLLNMLHKMV